MTLKPVPALFLDAAGQRPGHAAVRRVCSGRVQHLTVGDLARRALAAAGALRAAGLEPGDRVAVQLADRLDWLVADLAVLLAGGVTVELPASPTAAEVEARLHVARPRWAVGDVPGVPRVALDRPGAPLPLEWDAEGPAAVSFTSGSTAEPLAVELTHANLSFFVHAFPAALPRRAGDAWLSYLSVQRAGARQDFYACLAQGTAYCVPDPDLSFARNLALLKPTVLWQTPRFYLELHRRVRQVARGVARVAAPLWRGALRAAFCCGGPLPAEVEQALRERGLAVCGFYGMTEATSGIACALPGDGAAGTVGRPLPGVEVRLAHDGEVRVRAASVMRGYLQRPDLTAEALRDGWLHTGDLGAWDGPYLRLTGRKKEMLVLADGRNVSTAAIEAAVGALPGVRRALVVGEGRREPALLVVPRGRVPDAPAFLETLRRDAAAALAHRPAHERVRRFALLPRDLSEEAGEVTAWGKARRSVVEANFAEAVEAAYRS